MSEEFVQEEILPEKIKEIFKPNHPISIFTRDANGQTDNKYQSSIVRLTIDTMEIVAPVRLGMLVFFSQDDPFFIRLQFMNDVCEFESSYICKGIGQPPVWVVQIPHDGKKIQERVHGRIEFSVPVRVVEVTKGGEELPSFEEEIPVLKPISAAQGEAVTLLTRDISIGGIKIASVRPYSLNSELELSFEIPGYGAIRVLGCVLRVQIHRQDNVLIFFNAIRFIQASERDFRAINEFIFRTQFQNYVRRI